MKTDTQKSLLAEFAKPTYEEWRKAAEVALKGAPFDKKMYTATAEGITLQPIYNAGETRDGALPGAPDYARGTRAAGYLEKGWEVAQEMPASTPEAFNAEALEGLSRGQTALTVKPMCAVQAGKSPETCCGKCGTSLVFAADFETALKGVDLKKTPLYVQSGANGLGLEAILFAAVEKLGGDITALKGTLGADPVGLLAAKGELGVSAEKALAQVAQLCAFNAGHAPAFAAVCVDTLPYNKAGASAVEELAAALATGVEYMRACVSSGMSADDAAKQMSFALSIGPKFFMEIAKFRAFRVLWAQAARAFGASDDAAKARVRARTGIYNKTVHDPYVNMLRTTTEAFSAVVGGVDALTVGAFDEVVRKGDAFSRRIARNQSLILNEECEVRHVVDPAGGSYYIEALTAELCQRAWALFQETEKHGGIVAALKAGAPQAAIAKTVAARMKKFNGRRENLVGTNLFPNLAEKALEKDGCCKAQKAARTAQLEAMKAKADKAAVEAALKQGNVAGAIAAAKAGACACCIFAANADGAPAAVSALPQERMAAAYEALRAAADAYKAKTGAAPAIFLATMGLLRQHKARADFTRGFFQAGGFDIIYPKGFDSVDAAVKAASESKANVVVICSTDDTYPELVPPLAKALKAANPKMRVILAGAPAPECADAYKQAGLDDSISIRSDHYTTLKNLLTFTGVLA